MDSSSASTCEDTTRSDNVTVSMVAAKELAAVESPPAMNRKARKAAERKVRHAAAMKAKEAAEARAKAAAEAARKAEEESEVEMEDKDTSDWNAHVARLYRQFWIQSFSDHHGNYEDTTSIPAMRFTDGARSDGFTCPRQSLQIFSVKVKELNGDDLRRPLDVYGVVAVREAVDHSRNIIFSRTRDDPQTITAKDPFLVLTGPTRGVVVEAPEPNYFEFVLTAKGATELDDKELSFMTIPCMFDSYGRIAEASKLSTVELRFGQVMNSVEATIGVETTGGTWPSGFEAVFVAGTASAYKEVLLLASGDDKLPVDDEGKVKFSRRVVSVEIDGELTVSLGVFDLDGKKDVVRHNLVFTPKEAGRSWKMLKVGSCEMKVTVVWSLMSSLY